MFWRFSLLWTLSSYSLEKNIASGRGAYFSLLGRENDTLEDFVFFSVWKHFKEHTNLQTVVVILKQHRDTDRGQYLLLPRGISGKWCLRGFLSSWLASASEVWANEWGHRAKQSKHKAERPFTALCMRKKWQMCHSPCKIWTTGQIRGCWLGWDRKGLTLFLFHWGQTTRPVCQSLEKSQGFCLLGNKLYR